MVRKRVIGLVMTIAGVLPAGIAFGCEAARMTPSSQVVRLDRCAAKIQYGEFSAARLSEAEDIGQGFVLQVMSDGMACGGAEAEQIVQDCNSGRVAVFGEHYGPLWIVDPDAEPAASDLLIERVRSASSKGKPLSIDQILAGATKAGIEYRLEAETRSTLAINGHKFRLGCGCRTFYPDLPRADG